MTRPVLLVALGLPLLLAGCGHHMRLAPVVLTATVPPAPTPPPAHARTATAAVKGFSRSFVHGEENIANGYLTRGELARASITPLPIQLGVQGKPIGYTARWQHAQAGPQKIAVVTYTYTAGQSTVRLLVKQTSQGWRIGAISRVH